MYELQLFVVTNLLLRKWNHQYSKDILNLKPYSYYKNQYDVFLCNNQFCTFFFSVLMGVLSLWETGGTSRISKLNYRCCIDGAVTWRSQRGPAAIKWALLSDLWRCVEFSLRWTLLTFYMCLLQFQQLLIGHTDVVLFVTVVLRVWLLITEVMQKEIQFSVIFFKFFFFIVLWKKKYFCFLNISKRPSIG